jgi:hypothetical protein
MAWRAGRSNSEVVQPVLITPFGNVYRGRKGVRLRKSGRVDGVGKGVVQPAVRSNQNPLVPLVGRAVALGRKSGPATSGRCGSRGWGRVLGR